MKIRPVFCAILFMLCATHAVHAEEPSDDAYYYYLWKRDNPTAFQSDAGNSSNQPTQPIAGDDKQINLVTKPDVAAAPGALNEGTQPAVAAGAVDICKVASVLHVGAKATAIPVSELCATVRKTVQAWAEAWVSKNMNAYMAFYSDSSFVPEDALTRSAWKKQRARVLSIAGTIRLTLTKVKIVMLDPNHLQVTFMQAYWSKTYQDKVRKTLLLQLEEGAWKIVREQS